MLFFTADEHYRHKNIIDYCHRPFSSIKEMDETLIYNHNKVVGPKDSVVHAGDFALCSAEEAHKIIARLNGKHTFLNGDHDSWMGKKRQWDIRYYKIEKESMVVCHYCMRTWFKSHYNSWHCYAHSHARLEPIGKSWDIGVDNNGFKPVSFEEIREIMKNRPNNPNFIGDRNHAA